MNPPQRHRLDQREQGRRRVSMVTRASALAGTALAAVFGVALAQQANATAKPHAATQVAPRTTTSAPAGSTTPPAPSTSVVTPSTSTNPPVPTVAPTTAPAPAPSTLQPPVHVPTVAPTHSSGGTGSSGGS